MKFQKNTRDIWIETLCEKSEKILVYLTENCRIYAQASYTYMDYVKIENF